MKSLKSNRFILWYKSHYVMPDEFKPRLAMTNLANSVVLNHLIFLLSIIAISVLHIKYRGSAFEEKKALFYYFTYYFTFSIIGLTWGKILLRHPAKKPIFNSLPTIFCALSCLEAFGINFFHLGNYFSSVILLAIIAILMVVFFNVSPLYYLFLAPPIAISTIPIILKNIGIIGVIEVQVLGIIVIWLSYYNRRLKKKELIENKLLKEKEEELLNEVELQELELLEKEEVLEAQKIKIIEIQDNTIIGLSNLVENRDSDTGEHVRRTAAYVGVLSQQLAADGLYTDQIDNNFINLIIKAAPMHDIGKIIVPDHILKKPGKLTDEEFEEIKRHTKEGGRIVSEILGKTENENYVRFAQEIAEGHHEKWDGTGYPYNKKGDEIPLTARIMAVADVFDALVSPRCYKEPFTVDKAFEILEEGKGKHFEPVLIDTFIKLRPTIEQIMEKYKD